MFTNAMILLTVMCKSGSLGLVMPGPIHHEGVMVYGSATQTAKCSKGIRAVFDNVECMLLPAYKLKDSTLPARAIPPPSPPSPPTRRGHQGWAFTRPPGVDDHSDSQRRPIPRRLRLRLFAEERPLGSLGSTLGSAERPSRGQLNTGLSPSFRFEILQVLKILLEAKAPLLADVPHGDLAPLCM